MKKRNFGLLLVVASLVLSMGSIEMQNFGFPTNSDSQLVDIGDGQFIEVGPDEKLETYSLSDVPTTLEGEGSPLVISEYGQRTDQHHDLDVLGPTQPE